MVLKKLTADEIKANKVREYNPAAWDSIIASYLKFENVQFYIEEKESSPYDYDRFFAVYTIPEGIRIFGGVGYGASLSSNGFVKVYIGHNTGIVTTLLFKDATGKEGRADNSKANRLLFARDSKEYGLIYSNCI